LGPEIGCRQIIAGLAQFYQPEEIIGKQIIVVVNLEPKVFKGLESQGMLLAVGDDEPVLLSPNKEVLLGAKAR
ncbi:MAG: methionine--tRNA ligase, partial [Patescibacteria group bacterium]